MKLLSLTNGGFAKVDDEDFESVSKMKWFFDRGSGYVRSTKGKKILLHRLIMKAPDGIPVDHRYHDTLDNQKVKLRLCTMSKNLMNQRIRKYTKSSQYKGVSRKGKMWQAQIGVEGKRLYLGLFNTEIEAALAYNKAALKYHGHFSSLNVIEIKNEY